MKVLLANPRGFCAGVDRAIDIVERALKKHGVPIYVCHEVVHNKFVVDGLIAKGAIFVEQISEIPNDNVVIFSAHGVSKAVRKEARDAHTVIYDATCPLVTKVHKEVVRKQKQNYQVILIGHKGHPEVEGTLGQSTQNNTVTLVENLTNVDRLNISSEVNISYTTQTTLSVDETQSIVNKLITKFPNIQAPKKNDICYATQNRQNAVKTLVKDVDMLLVLGSCNSSNSNRLKEIADKNNIPAYLIDNANEIKPQWLKNKKTVGVTAGASAPEVLVQGVLKYLNKQGSTDILEVSGAKENLHFSLPEALRLI